MAPPRARQQSLFPESSDLEMLARSRPERVRRRLNDVLRLLREAETFPWAPNELRSWRFVFPQMTNWLPDDEAEDLKRAFWQEIERWGDEARDTDESSGAEAGKRFLP